MTILEYTSQQVKKMSKEDKLIIINHKIYDISTFIPSHPGGAVISTFVGQDATDAFNAFHPSTAHETLANYYIGDVVSCSSTSSTSSTSNCKKKDTFGGEIDALREEMVKSGLFESDKRYYLFKVISNYFILCLSIYCSIHQHTIPSAILLGLFWQQSGWLAHDFLHHQVFKKRWMNDGMGYLLGNIGQGFSVEWWKNKHNTHHAKPNIHDHDPDIDTMPILGWSVWDTEKFHSSTVFTRWILLNQSLFYFVILMFARISWCQQSILYTLQTSNNNNYYYNNDDDDNNNNQKIQIPLYKKVIELSTLLLHWISYAYIVSFASSVKWMFIHVVVSQCTCGLILALVFSLNHNGMPIFKQQQGDDDDEDVVDFYELQVLTGRNIQSNLFTDWFTGGLNSQIEHHLFPMLPRHNFHLIRERVKRTCEKYNVAYHETDMVNGTLEVLSHLSNISNHFKTNLQDKKQV